MANNILRYNTCFICKTKNTKGKRYLIDGFEGPKHVCTSCRKKAEVVA